MSYCLNPRCSQPQNPELAQFCQHCGSQLLLGDRYRALALIGEGGFGRTFRGIDQYKPSHPLCAIKQFSPLEQGWKQGAKALELFHQEAVRLEQLGDHPQIPALLAHFEQEQRQYLIQEFIPGPTLAAELATTGCFDPTQVWQLLRDLLPVLEFIHQHQVIHRDLKPENLIRRQSDQKLVLVDFGAAKFATETLLRQTGTVIGSAGYAAPEQLLGKAVYASDLYSLGVTCIHLLTQVPPCDLFDTTSDTWIWRDFLPQALSPALAEILDTLLERAIARRYPSAAAVLQVLQAPSPLPRWPMAGPSPRLKPLQLPRTPPAPAPHWTCVRTLNSHTSPVVAIALTPDGQTLVTCGQDGTIKLWDLATRKLQGMLGSGSGAVMAVALTPDGQTLISGSHGGSIDLWQLETGERVATLVGHNQPVRSLALSPDGLTLISGGSDQKINFWHLAQRTLYHTIATHTTIYSLAVHPRQPLLVSGGYDRTIQLWDLGTGARLQTLHWHLGAVYAIALSPNGQWLAGGGYEGTIKRWRWGEWEPHSTLTKHLRAVKALCFSPNSQLLASGGEDRLLKIWDLATGQAIATLQEHHHTITSLAFSPNGETLISGSQDHSIKLWRAKCQ